MLVLSVILVSIVSNVYISIFVFLKKKIFLDAFGMLDVQSRIGCERKGGVGVSWDLVSLSGPMLSAPKPPQAR